MTPLSHDSMVSIGTLCHASLVSLTLLSQNWVVFLTLLEQMKINFSIWYSAIDTAESIIEFLKALVSIKKNQIQSRVNFTTQHLWGKSVKHGGCLRTLFDSVVSSTTLSWLWIRISPRNQNYLWKHFRVWNSGLGEDVRRKNQRSKSRETVPLIGHEDRITWKMAW
jgi:hypothetical protein